MKDRRLERSHYKEDRSYRDDRSLRDDRSYYGTDRDYRRDNKQGTVRLVNRPIEFIFLQL